MNEKYEQTIHQDKGLNLSEKCMPDQIILLLVN